MRKGFAWGERVNLPENLVSMSALGQLSLPGPIREKMGLVTKRKGGNASGRVYQCFLKPGGVLEFVPVEVSFRVKKEVP